MIVAHATVTCPLGPTVKTFVGRKDRTTANPEGLLPNPHTDADTLVQNMQDKGFSPAELAALLGAHTSAKQFEFDPSHAGAPLDDTPGVWDVVSYHTNTSSSAMANIKYRDSTAKFWIMMHHSFYRATRFSLSILALTQLGRASLTTKTDGTRLSPLRELLYVITFNLVFC
jgi:hypothetical protein